MLGGIPPPVPMQTQMPMQMPAQMQAQMPAQMQPQMPAQMPMPPRQDDSACQVYVGNLPYNLRWQELKDHMKQVGQCVNARILTTDGTDWGRSRGVGIVRFSDAMEAQQAIAQLNGSELQGRAIVVDVWTGSSGKWQQEQAEWVEKWGPGAGKGKGGFGKSGYGKGGFGKGGGCFGKGFGRGNHVHGENLVYIGNLAYEVSWQDLKDHMKQAGNVEFCSVLTEDGTDWGRSKGAGCVRYSSEAEVQQAIAMLAESELKGRKILVDRWAGGSFGGKGGFGKGCGKGFARDNHVHGENLVYVGNLAFEVSWQDLKDHMRQAGTVEFCSILTEDGTDWGRSQGAGCVRYSSEAEVQQALAMLSETELKGRRILVDRWAGGKGNGK